VMVNGAAGDRGTLRDCAADLWRFLPLCSCPPSVACARVVAALVLLLNPDRDARVAPAEDPSPTASPVRALHRDCSPSLELSGTSYTSTSCTARRAYRRRCATRCAENGTKKSKGNSARKLAADPLEKPRWRAGMGGRFVRFISACRRDERVIGSGDG